MLNIDDSQITLTKKKIEDQKEPYPLIVLTPGDETKFASRLSDNNVKKILDQLIGRVILFFLFLYKYIEYLHIQ